MNKLRGVAVGAGYFSQFHLDAWKRIDNVDLVAICDTDKSKANTAAKEHDIASTYSNVVEMLAKEDPDFIDIITRPDSHLSLTKLAVDANVAVICQKPLAPTFEESKELVSIAEEGSVPLMVHENFRFQPWYREIKRILESGNLGDRLHSISIRTRTGDGWQPDAYLGRQPYFREMERFLVFEMGVHFIDTMRFLGGEIEGVYARLRKLNADIAGEDTGTVLFEFASGAQGMWDANRFNEPNTEDARYTFGTVLVETNGGSIRLYQDGRITTQRLGEVEQTHEYSHERRNFAGDCVFMTQKHFIDCLAASRPFETSGKAYLKTLEVQEAVYLSAERQLPVRNINA